ncbi:DNA replication and repair protein RecF [Mollicutes bacterium LVI A0039]|nr:DNA replication and repair protein RecF [Mollicutes bacterium LVI A0039]
MKITKLSLTNFRLHNNLSIDTNDNTVVIVGNNASGKTTIVEAIYYCCFFTSFRIKKTAELISFGQELTAVNLEYLKANRANKLDTYFNKEKRNIVFNGQKGQKRIDMMGELKVLLLTPNSDELVSSSPRVRRSFLDMYISQYNPTYRTKLLDYQKLAKQRAACLKTKPTDVPTLEIITEKYEALAEQLRMLRIEFTEEIDTLSGSIVSMLSRGSDNIKLSYKPSRREDLAKELKYGRNLYGLQYDDFEILLNDMPAKTYASQGQQRSIAMALILSQIELIFNRYHEYPVVIIDDVHIELDSFRQEILFELLNEKVQAFFVSTSIENMPSKIRSSGIHYHLENNEKQVTINKI